MTTKDKNVDVVRQGTQIILPANPDMSYDEAITWLQRKKEEEEQDVAVNETVECTPLDGAVAFASALEKGNGEENVTSGPKQAPASDDRFVRLGTVSLDLDARRVTMKDRDVDIPPTSFDYLLVLVRHSPNVVSFQTLVAEAQGYETDTREAQELTKWHIHHIRQAIEPDSRKPVYVINVRGTGYRLVME